ncbi:NTP transferase domain-containing protein [Paenibacillus thailandensis]|uniref:NTP transferase domain-containing protein n=1 Tax=Paenibacillus thailandensis TaxID=393250 RepID=A0ABW5QT53_9BACL
MADSAIILAGGLSKRYGKNKILEKFRDKTLLDYNIDFCIRNNIGKIIVVYYDEQVFTYLKGRYIREVENDIIILIKRPQSPEGTGMSLLTGARCAGGRFIVLFGDNYYRGILNDNSMDNIATYVVKEENEQNKRFAAIVDNKIIEKPHKFTSGAFFAGYMILNKDDVLEQPVLLSDRGEVEITDIFNRCEKKNIKQLDIVWEEITYGEDYYKMLEFIEATDR